MANLSAIVAARVAAFGEDADFTKATLYLSAEAHRSVAKAARIAGIPAANLRAVPVDSALRLDAFSLANMVAQDRIEGYRPFLVAATAGTTNTGAIDPLEDIADLCEREGIWLHIDGAYGGMFVLTAEGKQLLRGIGRADSVTLDPHKGLFLPYGCGALVVRRAATLLQAHAENASYLQDLAHRTEEPSPSQLGPELTRNDRGILVWLPLALHGLGSFRAALDEKLELARYFGDALMHLPVEIPVEPELSIVAFRLPRMPGETLAGWNQRNRAWLERINDRRRVHLSSTLLPAPEGEVFTLRVCILSFRTARPQIELALKELAKSLAQG
jgi:aromatic-L-amino-acid decarboxylase